MPNITLVNVKEDIAYYRIRKPIADAILKCVKMGFRSFGHGRSLVSPDEDFNLINEDKDLYVNFRDHKRKKCLVTVTTCSTLDDRGLFVPLFNGSIKKSIAFIEDYIKFQDLNPKCNVWKVLKKRV